GSPAAGDRIVLLLEAHHVLGDGPGQGGLAAGITGEQPGAQPLAGFGCEPVVAAAQDSADAVERVASAAPVTTTVLLDSPSYLVNGIERELGDVESIEHAHRVR